jgi:hypothetical protein
MNSILDAFACLYYGSLIEISAAIQIQGGKFFEKQLDFLACYHGWKAHKLVTRNNVDFKDPYN